MASTLSVFKFCAGGYVGNGHVHPAVIDAAREGVAEAKAAGEVGDGFVARCGDDVALILWHSRPAGASGPRSVADDALRRCLDVARKLGQHPPPDPSAEPETAEISFTQRPSEPVLCFLADKAPAAAWNLHLYRVFADPFNTPRLLSERALSAGFRFVLQPPDNGTQDSFELPEGLHRFLAAAVPGGRVVRHVEGRFSGEPAAVASAGPDPILLVRCEGDLPSVGEALEAFAFPYALGGSSLGGAAPLMPVSTTDDGVSRSDGPPRVVGLGFQISGDRLVGPRDLLGDRAFDEARRQALVASEYLRRHGPFAPGVGRPAHSLEAAPAR